MRVGLAPLDLAIPGMGTCPAGSAFGIDLGTAGGSILGAAGAGGRAGGAPACGGAGSAIAAVGAAIIAVGSWSGVTAGAPEAMAFPQDLQNLVSTFASAPQFTQIRTAAATAGGGAALPSGAAQLAQNFAPGLTASPQEGQTLPGSSLAAVGAPQLRQKRPKPASAAHFGHFIATS